MKRVKILGFAGFCMQRESDIEGKKERHDRRAWLQEKALFDIKGKGEKRRRAR